MRARSLPLSLAGWATLACAVPAIASGGAGRIEDNSFLIEEAYNQEPGVLHHISTFQRSARTGEWLYTFTEEWPVGGLAHQAGATLPVERVGRTPRGTTGIGDVALHYRYAFVDGEGLPVAAVVRTSLLLPSGDRSRGLGEGRPGGQLALPVSVKLGDRVVEHVNLYGTWFRPGGTGASRSACAGWGAGDGLVWLAHPELNFMLEALWTETIRTRDGATTRTRTFTLNPAFRSALDFVSGLQIVWGLGAPVGVGPSRGERGLFAYLSFEHPLRSAGAGGHGDGRAEPR